MAPMGHPAFAPTVTDLRESHQAQQLRALVLELSSDVGFCTRLRLQTGLHSTPPHAKGTLPAKVGYRLLKTGLVAAEQTDPRALCHEAAGYSQPETP